MTRQVNKTSLLSNLPIHWPLALAVLALMFVGVAFIYSATSADELLRSQPWHQQRHIMQAIWYVIGCVLAVALCIRDYRWLCKWTVLVYGGTILALILVLIPGIGVMRFGARRWFDLGIFLVQPSEFAKIGFIMALAHYLSRPPEELRRLLVFFKSLAMMALPFLLILKEPDLGSALILLPVGAVMMLVAGMPKARLVKLGLAAGLLVTLILVDVLFAPPNWRIKLEDYQRRRLMVFFGLDYVKFAPPNATAAERQRLRAQQQNDAYSSRQALISVGSGGLTGKGWRQGSQIALGYLPKAVAHNDFIFSVIAEESGFIGSVVVVALYGVILVTGIWIASQARDRLSKLLAVGAVTLIFSHVFINIGMNIRIMPVTGVPLPLLSYGGSSVLTSMIAIGLLQNVYLYRRE